MDVDLDVRGGLGIWVVEKVEGRGSLRHTYTCNNTNARDSEIIIVEWILERWKGGKEKNSRIYDRHSSAARSGVWGLAPMKGCGGYGQRERTNEKFGESGVERKTLMGVWS